VPLQQRVGFEQEHDVTKLGPAAVRQVRQFTSEDDQRKFLPAGNARRVRIFTLENPQLLPQEQDFDILVVVSLTTQSDEVEQQREGVCHKEKEHAD
jgi:hypothetical protein